MIQNENLTIADAAQKVFIKPSVAYKFHKQWRLNGGSVLPGYVPASEVKPKGNNAKLNAEHSQFLEQYVEDQPTCIIKDATASLCDAFQGLTIDESTVYRHLTEKLSFTLIRT